MAQAYYTPVDVARALARHAPRRISSILEPAVGSGILLQPLLGRLSANASNIVCIDRNPSALAELDRIRSSLPVGSLKVFCSDFLNWAKTPQTQKCEFDCILMNPPFAAKRSEFVEVSYHSDVTDLVVRRVPVEAAFIATAIGLLKNGGRLLAILPSSVIATDSCRWLREHLLNVGCVQYVHELPPFTFEKVSARVYLFVFEKCSNQRTLILMNHDLAEPEKLRVDNRRLGPNLRFDYGWNHASATLQSLEGNKRRLNWRTLGEVATILRGEVDSPKGVENAVHTTCYLNGFWRRPNGKRPRVGVSNRRIGRDDLLVKRVGRNCSKTIGPVLDASGYAASDCVTIIRTHKPSQRLQILFALRVLLAGEIGGALLESGAGASYLTNAQLLDTKVPVNLASAYPKIFSRYILALRRRSFSDVLRLENQARKILFRCQP